MNTSNQMYAILRQLCDPEYAGPEPPTQQDMMDAIAAYEIEQKMSGEAGNVPRPITDGARYRWLRKNFLQLQIRSFLSIKDTIGVEKITLITSTFKTEETSVDNAVDVAMKSA